jgi:hypothetical protein
VTFCRNQHTGISIYSHKHCCPTDVFYLGVIIDPQMITYRVMRPLSLVTMTWSIFGVLAPLEVASYVWPWSCFNTASGLTWTVHHVGTKCHSGTKLIRGSKCHNCWGKMETPSWQDKMSQWDEMSESMQKRADTISKVIIRPP